MFAAMAVLLSSCGDDEEEEVPTPSITLAANSVQDGTSLTPGASVNFVFSAAKGENDLALITITAKNAQGDGQVVDNLTLSGFASDKTVAAANVITLEGDDKNNGVINGSVTVVAPTTEDTYSYTITVTDSKDVTTTKVVSVTVKAVSTKTVVETANQELGAQEADPGSYYSVGDKKVYKSSEVANSDEIKAKVNFSFAQTGESTVTDKLVSLSARGDEKLTANTSGGIDTYFMATSIDYATVTADQIEDIEASSNLLITIEAGKTYEFVSNGVKGLVKVNSISGDISAFTGVANISVKIAE
jgi:hypothetical protein